MDGHETDRELWNERYRSGRYPSPDDPADLVAGAAEWLPEGRALDVATGTGRNALFLAEQGYDVDAVDISEVELDIAQQKATEHGVHVNWIHAYRTCLSTAIRRSNIASTKPPYASDSQLGEPLIS